VIHPAVIDYPWCPWERTAVRPYIAAVTFMFAIRPLTRYSPPQRSPSPNGEHDFKDSERG